MTAHHAAVHIEAYPSQHISNYVWALATIGAPPDHPLPAALNRIGLDLRRRLSDPGLRSEMTSQHIANLLWAYATLDAGPAAAPFAAAAADAALAILPQFTRQEARLIFEFMFGFLLARAAG